MAKEEKIVIKDSDQKPLFQISKTGKVAVVDDIRANKIRKKTFARLKELAENQAKQET